jgi:hypothetical protein
MTSDGKIRANRRNAARSTGPRSAAGRARSRLNRRRHGLSTVGSQGHAVSPEAERLAHLLAEDNADPERLAQARIAAEAHLTVLRIRAARVALLGTTASSRNLPGHQLPPESAAAERAEAELALAYLHRLPALAGLDQYERKALARRKRALAAMNRLSARRHCEGA